MIAIAITNGYLTLSEIKSYLNISDTNDDTELEIAVEAASRAIDRYCRRQFYSTSATRVYTSTSTRQLYIDDLTSVTSLKTDTNGDGTYNETWTSSDYILKPDNAPADGRPYTYIVRHPNGDFSFPTSGHQAVEIVGTFGWPSVPVEIKQACAIQAQKLFQVAKDGGGGLAQFGLEGGVAVERRQSLFLERSAQLLLTPYRFVVIA